MAEATLLASTRVLPELLQEYRFRYRHPLLEAALRHVLGR
jgi:NAD dependent epimerase/dehydratase family enzyme